MTTDMTELKKRIYANLKRNRETGRSLEDQLKAIEAFESTQGKLPLEPPKGETKVSPSTLNIK